MIPHQSYGPRYMDKREVRKNQVALGADVKSGAEYVNVETRRSWAATLIVKSWGWAMRTVAKSGQVTVGFEQDNSA